MERAVLQEVLHLTSTRLLLLDKDTILAVAEENLFRNYMQRVLDGEPLQYITGKIFFMGMELGVAPGVLIPRPETEEMVYLISQTDYKSDLRILDIGTGSGCIACALAKEFTSPEKVYGLEISPEAISVAQHNFDKVASDFAVTAPEVLEGSLFDFPQKFSAIPPFDLIVSNPPYIMPSESNIMESHVLDHEPHIALFAPQDDPLIFYKGIAGLIPAGFLAPAGEVWVEINALLAEDTLQAMKDIIGESHTFSLIKDLSRKDRFIHIKSELS